MKFADMIIAIESEEAELDSILKKCSTFAEASYNEYLINLKEAELKVVQENGTPEDYIYLEKGASEGFIVKGIKTIKKMIDALIQWIKSLCDKLTDFISEKKTEMALKRMKDAAEKDPSLKGKKVEIPDIDKQQKVFDKYKAQIDRKIAMFKAGKFNTEKDSKDLDEIEKSFDKERAITLGATVTVAIGVVVGAIISHVKDAPKNLKTEMIDIKYEEISEPEDMENFIHAEQIRTAIVKENGSAIKTFVQDAFNSVKSFVTKSGEVPVDGILKNKNESVETEPVVEEPSTTEVKERTMDELDQMLNEIIQEASEEEPTASFNAESYLESMEAELFGEEETEVEESSEDGEVTTPEQYLEALEAELFTEEDDKVVEESASEEGMTYTEFLESLEAELFGEEETEVEESAEDDGMSAEEFLEALEAELFGNEDDSVTFEQYLDTLEAELFGEE